MTQSQVNSLFVDTLCFGFYFLENDHCFQVAYFHASRSGETLGNCREWTAATNFSSQPLQISPHCHHIDFGRGLDDREEGHVGNVKTKCEKRVEKENAFSV